MNDISQIKRKILFYIAAVLLILIGGGLGGSAAAYYVLYSHMNQYTAEYHNRSENNPVNLGLGSSMISDYETPNSYNEATRTTTIEQNTLD